MILNVGVSRSISLFLSSFPLFPSSFPIIPFHYPYLLSALSTLLSCRPFNLYLLLMSPLISTLSSPIYHSSSTLLPPPHISFILSHISYPPPMSHFSSPTSPFAPPSSNLIIHLIIHFSVLFSLQ